VNKSQLIDALAVRYEGNRKAAQHALDAVLDTITREVAKGEKVAITGFGSFEKRVRNARWVRNPQTGERIRAKRTSVPKFSAGQDLKNVVSGAKKLDPLPRVSKTAAAASSTARKATAKATGTAKKAAAKATGAAKKTATKSTGTAKKTAAKSTGAAKKTATKSTGTAKKTATKSTGTAKKTATKSTGAAKKTATKSTGTAKKTAKAPAKKAAKKS
jgi:DNA-binding protein HU-beta